MNSRSSPDHVGLYRAAALLERWHMLSLMFIDSIVTNTSLVVDIMLSKLSAYLKFR